MPNNANLYFRRATEFEERPKLTFDFGQKNAYVALANDYRQLAACQISAHFRTAPSEKPTQPNG
jgi:hypothetical protein